MTDTTDKKAIIRKQNDEFRKRVGIPVFNPGIEGKILMTQGICSLPPIDIIEIWAKVRNFDAFTNGNDPYREHDFGAFDHGGKKVFWKIDYFDDDYLYGSADPSELSTVCRVLTIMLAEEY